MKKLIIIYLILDGTCAYLLTKTLADKHLPILERSILITYFLIMVLIFTTALVYLVLNIIRNVK